MLYAWKYRLRSATRHTNNHFTNIQLIQHINNVPKCIEHEVLAWVDADRRISSLSQADTELQLKLLGYRHLQLLSLRHTTQRITNKRPWISNCLPDKDSITTFTKPSHSLCQRLLVGHRRHVNLNKAYIVNIIKKVVI